MRELFSLSVMTNTRLSASNSQEKISDGRDHYIWDCESLLYDSYELVSFVHVIERKLMPFSPLARQSSGLTLRALMDKDNDDCSSASTTRVRYIHRRNRKKNDKMKERIKKMKMFIDCSFWWNSCCKNLFF